MFFQSGRSYYGVSHRRKLGIGVCRVPFGVLIVSFGRKQYRPQMIVPRVEEVCDLMWR